MNIDWFTFIAQIINFLVLVALLKRFLYRPIVKAIREREEKIAARFAEADDKQRVAEQEAESYRQQNRAWDQQRNAPLEEAKRNAEETRKHLLQEARDEVQQQRQEWLTSLAGQRDALVANIRARATTQVIAATRRTLHELAGVDLEERLAERFVSRVEGLDPARCQELSRSLRGGQPPPEIRTAFKLTEDWRKRIRRVLRDKLDVELELKFKTSSDVLCGIELVAAGHKLGWSVNEFLAGLDEQIHAALPDES